MPSLQSKIMYLAMRHRHLFQFRLRRAAWDEHTSIPAFREQCERYAVKAGPIPPGVDISPIMVDHLPAEWIRSEEEPKNGTILYIHGGGYISGSCSDHRMFVAKLVKRCGVAALLYEYRLAPEHPYPAALEDTVTTYQWLLEQGYRPDRTLFVGESAGAGLELAALLALRDRGIPLPSAVVSMSPVTDLTLSGESHRINARSCLSPPGMAEVCAKAYAGEQDPVLPYISPLFGDLQGLPPLFITAGGSEILRDDAIRFADKASKSGVETRLLVGEGMMHCYPLMAPFFPEATRAMDEITQFIHQHLPSM